MNQNLRIAAIRYYIRNVKKLQNKYGHYESRAITKYNLEQKYGIRRYYDIDNIEYTILDEEKVALFKLRYV